MSSGLLSIFNIEKMTIWAYSKSGFHPRTLNCRSELPAVRRGQLHFVVIADVSVLYGAGTAQPVVACAESSLIVKCNHQIIKVVEFN